MPERAVRPWWRSRRIGTALAMALALCAVLIVAPPLLRPPPAPPGERDALYFVMVDRFADGVPDPPDTVDRADPQAWHGGDLPGLLGKLDHLDRLGVGAVWLSPVWRSRQAPHGAWGAFHGYWVEDLRAIEPRFGTVADLRALSDALHARGMRLYLDMVYNHVAPDAPLLAEHPDWFHGHGDVLDWDDPVQAVTHDVHGLPDLAQENEEVYAWLRDASLEWIAEVRPDGFRVDAVRHLPEGFLARLGDELRARAPGFELIGEIYDGNVDRVAARARADKLDAVFDFPLYFAIREGLCGEGVVGQVAALVGADYGGARPVTLVDNHDLPRILSVCGEDPDRAALALAVQLTARGTPSITWGTEIALSGAEEPANRGDMGFDGPEVPIGATVRELLALRRQWPALQADETRVVGLSQHEALFARIGERETVTVAVRREGEGGGAPPRWTALGEPDEARVVAGAGPLGTDGWGAGTVRIERHRGVPAFATGPVALTLRLLDQPELAEGDRIVLVGPGQLLGAWDPDAGVRLEVDGAFHLPVRDGEVLQYKPVVVHADGSATWEPHPDRFLVVTSDRWTGGGRCGAWCAPVEPDGTATAAIRWADATVIEAVLARDVEALGAAVAAGADLRVRDDDGRTALQLAADLGDDGMVAALLDVGAPIAPDLVNRAVRTPNDRLLAVLLARDLPIDRPDAGGVTPLMVAVEAENLGAARRLLQLGADPDRRDAAGRSARDRAGSESMRSVLAVVAE